MNMHETELIPHTIILGEHNYAEGLDLVIQQAEHSLAIFDQDLTLGGYASVKRFEIIQRFLNLNIHSKLTLILHDSDYFTKHCPRLYDLLEIYGHKMTVYITNDTAKVAKDCFVIADNKHFIRRIHVDHARFKFAMDDIDTCASLNMRFNELLDETSVTISRTQIGL